VNRTTLEELLETQEGLQRRSFGIHPSSLVGEDRADYVLWNVLALTDELHEALQEVKWKPWLTTGRGVWVDRDAYVEELVDALHFLLNLLLVSGCSAEEVARRYLHKVDVNARRQSDGYDGSKDDDGRHVDYDVERT